MSIDIDPASATFTFDRNGAPHRCAIMDACIVTDPDKRMSRLQVGSDSLLVTEAEAEHLIALGARDDRRNLIVDDQ